MKVRILSLPIVALICCLGLSGCGGSGGEATFEGGDFDMAEEERRVKQYGKPPVSDAKMKEAYGSSASN